MNPESSNDAAAHAKVQYNMMQSLNRTNATAIAKCPPNTLRAYSKGFNDFKNF
jgi:hypothetical protein